jgi:hypothetical protein
MHAVAKIASGVVALGLSFSPVQSQPSGDFLPVSLKCPADNKGVLELVLEGKASVARMRVTYKSGKPVFADYAAGRDRNQPYDKSEMDKFNLARPKNPGDFNAGMSIVGRVEPERKSGCEGSPESRRKYFEQLKQNEQAIKASR